MKTLTSNSSSRKYDSFHFLNVHPRAYLLVVPLHPSCLVPPGLGSPESHQEE